MSLQRHGSHTRHVAAPRPHGHEVTPADRDRAEDERQRLALCGMDPWDIAEERWHVDQAARDAFDEKGPA